MLTPTKAMATTVVAILLLLTSHNVSSGQVSGSSEVQTWLDDTLQHKIEAKFKGMEGNLVKLEVADGSIKKIPYAKLSLSSQLKVKKLADPRSFDAPPLPSSYSAPPVSDSPFTPDDSIDKFLEVLTQQLKDGHADVLWHALPPAGKADLEACVIKIAEILGPNTFKQMQVVLPNLHTIVRDKRSFIVGSTSIASQPEIAKMLNQALPAMEPMVDVFTKPATWNSENFKEGKVGPWLMLFGNDALGAMKSMEKALKPFLPPGSPDMDLANAKFKVLEKTADTAKVEMTNGPQKQIWNYKKIDGYWVDPNNTIVNGLAQAKGYLENLDQAGRDEMKNQVRTGLTAANVAMGALAKAKSQQEFNQFFDPIATEFVKGFQQGLMRSRQNQGMAGQPGPGGMAPQRKSISSGLSGVGSQSQ